MAFDEQVTGTERRVTLLTMTGLDQSLTVVDDASPDVHPERPRP